MDAVASMLDRGLPYSLTIEEDSADLPVIFDWRITDRLLGFAIDNSDPEYHAYQLYHHLYSLLGIPSLSYLAETPLPLKGCYITNKQGGRISRPPREGDYAVHFPLDSAKVVLNCCTGYMYTMTVCLDCPYQQGIRLLRGLDAGVAPWLLFWFDRSAPKVPLTVGDYIALINADT